ncbi:MAG: PilN domain-containing protein [Gammaproteobacteria bacterium]|nr:PilN domain-containing protein [Gammaproteobacteria bacterium]
MKVIQELQGNRPIIVRVFDELARSLAPRVFFTSIQMSEAALAINGVAESNNRISNQLRNFSESEWFVRPNVTAINADPNQGPQASQFALTVHQTTPKKEEVE